MENNFQKGLSAGLYQPTALARFLAHRRPYHLLSPPQSLTLPRMVIVPDVSFYQDKDTTPQGIDFARMRDHGAAGVIIRAGQGRWPDPDFATNWQNAKNAGLPCGAYLYYDPGVSPREQADRLSALLAADPPELDLWADLEFPLSWGGAYGAWPNFYDYLERLKVNLPTVQQTIYTGFYWWHDFVVSKTTATQLAYFAQYPLNIAWYTDTPALVKIPPPWTAPRWWQFTSWGDGLAYGVESLEIDLNAFVGGLGTLEDFQATFRLGTPPPPAGGSMYYLTVMAAYLNGRNAPNGVLNFPSGSTLPTGFRKDDKLESPEFILDSNGITKWYRITKCTRAGVNVVLPTPVWASDGGTYQYLRVDAPPAKPSIFVSHAFHDTLTLNDVVYEATFTVDNVEYKPQA